MLAMWPALLVAADVSLSLTPCHVHKAKLLYINCGLTTLLVDTRG
jgi:hypothetical protein